VWSPSTLRLLRPRAPQCSQPPFNISRHTPPTPPRARRKQGAVWASQGLQHAPVRGRHCRLGYWPGGHGPHGHSRDTICGLHVRKACTHRALCFVLVASEPNWHPLTPSTLLTPTAHRAALLGAATRPLTRS